MKKMFKAVLLVALSSISIGAMSETMTLRLSAPEFKPLTYSEAGKLKGLGVEKAISLLEMLDWPYDIHMVPNYGRALAEIQAGRSHGLFLASENAERNEIALFSSPILYNRWSWFSLKDAIRPDHSSFKEQAKLGTILNTNTHRWLLENGYNVLKASADPKQLMRLLESGRLDAVFLAELVFLEAIKDEPDFPEFKQVVEVNKPMGIYISRGYAKQHPEFMPALNEAISVLNDFPASTDPEIQKTQN